MKSLGSRSFVIIPFLVAGLVLPALALGVEGHFERALQVTGPVELDVSTGSGYIHVRTGGASTVQVSGTIKAGHGWDSDNAEQKVRALEANPPIEQHGNIIKIGHIDNRELQRNISISYDIVTPKETRLRSATGSGDQTIESIRGPLETSSGSGDLRVSGLGDEVKASTGSGSIELNSVEGSVRASTGSGSIRARGVAGGFRASTGSGSITLEQSAPGDVEVSAASGTIRLMNVQGALHAQTASGNISAEGQGTSPWRFSTASGSVRVRLAGQQGFTLHAHTVSGSIQSARPTTVQGAGGRHEVNGTVGDGSLQIEVSTVSGNITVD